MRSAVPRGPGATVRALVGLAVSLAAVVAAAQQITTTVVAPDGVALATDVYLPVLGGLPPWPTVLQRTPYGRTGLHDECVAFTLLGYACVAQDERGTGDSGGAYSGYLYEGADGRAALGWIAEQWWSNRRVGTFGASALGMTQYAMAPGAPEALQAQAPIVGTPDFYHQAVYQGGALRLSLTSNWLAEQGAGAVFQQLARHRFFDSFWESFAVLPEVASIHVPGLHIGGWYDIFAQGTLDAFSQIQHHGGAGAAGTQRLIMGPWTHYDVGKATAGELTYPENADYLGDLFGMLVDWFGHWLRGASTPLEARPPVEVYLMGAVGEAGAPGNVWVALPDWPPPCVRQSFYLDVAGGLGTLPDAGGEVTLVSDPDDPVPTLGGQNLFRDLDVGGRPMGAGPYDQRPVEARADVVTFSTAPLERPLTIMGRVTATVWVRPDTPDLDLAVRLTDVYPDGRSMLVTDGIQRARMRCSDVAPCFLTPGAAQPITVDLWSTALVFNAGHRIRVDVSGSNWPRFEVNPNDGGDFGTGVAGVVAHPRILVGPATPSRLELPVASRGVRRVRGR